MDRAGGARGVAKMRCATTSRGNKARIMAGGGAGRASSGVGGGRSLAAAGSAGMRLPACGCLSVSGGHASHSHFEPKEEERTSRASIEATLRVSGMGANPDGSPTRGAGRAACGRCCRDLGEGSSGTLKVGAGAAVACRFICARACCMARPTASSRPLGEHGRTGDPSAQPPPPPLPPAAACVASPRGRFCRASGGGSPPTSSLDSYDAGEGGTTAASTLISEEAGAATPPGGCSALALFRSFWRMFWCQIWTWRGDTPRRFARSVRLDIDGNLSRA
mmetsp:Transcript_49798/g.166406  ORF Transcript_49798/g.166406 Transcript_49798/m.166406 type:complete len:277 (+) Transcript_49798:143-973(+)